MGRSFSARLHVSPIGRGGYSRFQAEYPPENRENPPERVCACWIFLKFKHANACAPPSRGYIYRRVSAASHFQEIVDWNAHVSRGDNGQVRVELIIPGWQLAIYHVADLSLNTKAVLFRIPGKFDDWNTHLQGWCNRISPTFRINHAKFKPP